jgi:hypothetical protein
VTTLRIWLFALAVAIPALAGVTGSIAGTVFDGSGAVIMGATVTVTEVSHGFQTTATTDAKGAFKFPSLPVGRYDLKIQASGFKSYSHGGLVVNTNSALQADAQLQLGEFTEEVTVRESAAQVDSVSSQMGEVVTAKTMTAVALNGRSYTDLLALQPGVMPMTTQQPDSIVMAGASVAIPPSGNLNPGNQSISGQREDANGFLVNGGNVKEFMNGGTSIVPNLDSIAEFRILTNNFDAEYGNYSGGIVNVVTKSGANALHGSGFEFLRNTVLDAHNFLSPERGFFRQNQFGGVVGGPVVKNKVFFFADYQGTRANQGIDTGLIPVPSLADRAGNLRDQASSLNGTVAGPYLAGLLSQKLGYGVTANEPYYLTGCVTNLQCVFPNAVIPQRAWSEPARHLLSYIPPPNSGDSTFSTSSQGKKLRDGKGSLRIDGNTRPWGLLSAYYYFDDYNLDNPYPTGQGGANVPGFNALTLGRAQLLNLGESKTFGATAVNELRFSYIRSAADLGRPSGGRGPTLASQGFVTGPGTPGIVVLAPQLEGVENINFSSFTLGTTITGLKQANNTYALNDVFSKVWGPHTIKAGFELSIEQVNVNPNPTFNGSFTFYGSETGSGFADFLIGVPSNYNQADARAYYARHKYASAFLQDSWKATSTLTLNAGVRWDRMEYWSEKYNQIPTLTLGALSTIYPTAPVGLLFPGDPGIPSTLAPSRNRFDPRVGLAYSPSPSDGLLGKIFGGPGKTAIRAGFGLFYSVIQGNTVAFIEPAPPFGQSYTSPGPPLFATPFITAANGAFQGQPFPIQFPRLNYASQSRPDTSVDFSPFIPINGLTTINPHNTFPYNENYFFSIEREVARDTLFSLSYVGSQAHHLLVIYSVNPGNPAVCLALSRPGSVAPGTPTCGPFGEGSTYTTAFGKQIYGTRGPFASNYGNDDYTASIANSNYNSLQATLRHSGARLNFLIGYTFSKSIDQSSSLADAVNPFNFSQTRALSAFDLTHNLVASYQLQLPLERVSKHGQWLTRGWSVSGITRISSGFPVTISSDGDRSLTGSLPNGVNNHSLDLPDYTPGNLNLNHDPRNGQAYFNTGLFAPNALGTPGNASRRSFHGPGMFNSDIALLRSVRFSESKTLEFRMESFNTFNHAQFFGPSAVNGNRDSDLFGQVVKAGAPRLVQAALKLTF